ncbi:MAG: ABC transporter permease [Bacillota bacterium]
MKFKIISKFQDKKADSLANIGEDSVEHARYIKMLKRKKRTVLLLQIAIFFGIIIIWEVGARVGFIDSFIMSSPSAILETTITLAKGELLKHIGVTMAETVLGFLISMAIGLFLAIALWSCETAQKIFQPYLVILNALPKIALGPIIIIWVGTGTEAIITMVILICVIITTITLLQGFLEVDSDMIFLVKSMGGGKFTIFTKLVFPSQISLIISTLKINVGLAFVGSIMGEYLVSRAGLGYLIVYGSQVFNLDLVMTSTIILLVAAGGMYALVALLEKKVSKSR